jgi:hypothetical protein
MQMLFLLSLSPIPHNTDLLAYIFGGKNSKVTWWQYWIPVTASGSKLFVTLYAASKADDLKEILRGEASPVETLLTVTSVLLLIWVLVVISRAAKRRLRKISQMSEEPVVIKERRLHPCRTAYYCLSSSCGLVTFILALTILVKLTPIFEPLHTLQLPRMNCANITTSSAANIMQMDILLNQVYLPLPVVITNRSPVKVIMKVTGGDVLSGTDASKVGYITPSSVTIPSCERRLGSSDDPVEVRHQFEATILKLSDLQITDEFALASIYPAAQALAAQMASSTNAGSASTGAAAPGSSVTQPCEVPASGTSDAGASATYMACLQAQCEDADIPAWTGLASSCAVAKMAMTCDGDLSILSPDIATGTLVKIVCPQACSACPGGRRLEPRRSANRPDRIRKLVSPTLESAPLILNLQGEVESEIELLAGFKIKKKKTLNRFQRSNINIDLQTTLTKELATQLAAGTLQEMLSKAGGGGGVTACAEAPVQDETFCASEIDLLFGNIEDVRQRDGVSLCDKLGPSREEFSEQEETKWVFALFFMIFGIGFFFFSGYYFVSEICLLTKTSAGRSHANDEVVI